MLVECPKAKAKSIAERVRRAIDEHVFQQEDGSPLTEVTASIGLFTATRGDTTVDTAINNADRAMYAAKRKGRNCTVAYSSELEK